MSEAAVSIVQIARDAIEPSPTNPRKVFDKGKLEELADSFPRVGILHPLTVRKLAKPKGRVTHQLSLGERRWRAASIAKLETVPCVVNEWTDDQVFEAQLIENAERTDLTPLEEADTYAGLMNLPGYTAERVADKTGRPLDHVKERLRLAKLAPVVREQLEAEKFGIAIALLIARLPGTEQPAAAKKIAAGRDGEQYRDGDGNWKRETRPYTIREAQALLQREHMLQLARAPFPIDDATLVPAAGACSSCPKRTGNQPALFADIKNADTCTDLACFKKKTDAEFTRRAKEHEAKGGKVLDAKDAKKIFRGGADHRTGHASTASDSRLVPLDQGLPYELGGGYDSKKTWSSIIGKEKPPIILAKDPESGAVRELVDRTDALAVAKKAGKLTDKGKPSQEMSPSQKANLKARKAELAKDRIRAQAFNRALTKISEAGYPAKAKEAAWWRAFVALLMESRLNSGERTVGEMITGKEWRGWMRSELTKHINKLTTAPELAGFAAMILVADGAGYGRRLEDEGSTMAKLCGVDWNACLKLATDAAKAELAAKEAKRAAKAGKKARRG